ncbi:MAG: hypothetical protein NVS4B6_15670 [Mycobacterium sp.]
MGGFETWTFEQVPDELRERAVRMVAEVRPQHPAQWAPITAVAGMLGIGTPRDVADLDPALGGRLGREAGCDLADG